MVTDVKGKHAVLDVIETETSSSNDTPRAKRLSISSAAVFAAYANVGLSGHGLVKCLSRPLESRKGAPVT